MKKEIKLTGAFQKFSSWTYPYRIYDKEHMKKHQKNCKRLDRELNDKTNIIIEIDKDRPVYIMGTIFTGQFLNEPEEPIRTIVTSINTVNKKLKLNGITFESDGWITIVYEDNLTEEILNEIEESKQYDGFTQLMKIENVEKITISTNILNPTVEVLPEDNIIIENFGSIAMDFNTTKID